MSGRSLIRGQSSAESRLAGTAAAALVLGACVYLLDRDWASTLFLGALAPWQPARHAVFGALGATLPSLLHAYAFTVLLIVAVWPWPRARGWACVGWWAVASALEILQAPAVALAVFGPPENVGNSALFHSVALYAWRGAFDPADLVATAIGCATGWLVTTTYDRRTA